MKTFPFRPGAVSLIFVIAVTAPAPHLPRRGSSNDTGRSALPTSPLAPPTKADGDSIPYRSAWRRRFPFQIGLAPEGVSDDGGTLWLRAQEPHAFVDFLLRIDAAGTIGDTLRPQFPLSPGERVAYLTPAVSGGNVGLLASLASGGKDETFEGAFFVPVSLNGAGAPVRVAARGPQFPTLVGTGAGEFVAAGDQEPLTIMKLDRGGRVLWRRSLSRQLALPTVSVASSGAIFVLSQTKHDLVLHILDAGGNLIRSRRIAARQGTVLANSDGGCTILCSRKFSGEENVVSLIRLDVSLRQIAEVQTPLVGRGGRDYELYRSPRGFLAVGACRADLRHGSESPYAVAEFDSSGELLWQRRLSARNTPLIVPFGAGFYLAEEVATYGEGTEVEKFFY